MLEIKTNKEYQAFLHEIEMIKDSNSREEEEILRLMDEIKKIKKGLIFSKILTIEIFIRTQGGNSWRQNWNVPSVMQISL